MDNHIVEFFHCKQCLVEKPDGISPRDWTALEVGWTRAGVQVWCRRHERNVIALDFLGQKIDFEKEKVK